jgi:hypothetical protein
MYRRNWTPPNKNIVKAPCGHWSSRKHIADHGCCKACLTGEPTPVRRTGRSLDDIAREGGYEDTMGVSPEALESYHGGDYGDY